MTTTNEPLSSVAMAVECAAEIMGWEHDRTFHYPCAQPHTFFITGMASHDTVHVIRAETRCGEHWEPWCDPRAWWEIVSVMEADEHLFDLRTNTDGTKEASFHRMKQPRGTFRATARTPGDAVMLAALAAKRS